MLDYNRTILQIIFNISLIFLKKTLILQSEIKQTLMIQRIQTFYLLLVILLTAALPFWVNLWSDAKGKEIFAKNDVLISGAFMGAAVLALVAILLYKKRQNQFVVNRLNMILNLFLLGFFVYRSLNLSGEIEVSEKGIGMLIPIFSIVFLVLANKAIRKDEDLVKSVDRLR